MILEKEISGRQESILEHSLQPFFEDIKAFDSIKSLKRSSVYQSCEYEIQKVINGVEYRNHLEGNEDPDRLRVVAWNVERGANLSGIIHLLLEDPVLRDADVLLLTETDVGMGRSGNKNIPREIADAVNMNYCFANSFLVLGKGDEGEQKHDLQNTLSMHGVAILTRHRIHGYRAIQLPEIRNPFEGLEKSLGQRRGLICRFLFGGRLFDFATVHLDVKASPQQRALQLEALCKGLKQDGVAGSLIGGDLNTHTYNMRDKLALMKSFFYKLFFLGVKEVVANYMMPDRFFEKEVFSVFRKYGFDISRFNNMQDGTIFYDLKSESLDIKTREWLPGFLYRYIHHILEPWNGKVPLRLDWMAGRGLKAVDLPRVINMPIWNGARISDHYPIVVDLDLQRA